MSWKISVSLDIDQENVGLITATWTDANLAFDVFTYSKRIKVNIAEVNAFIVEAIVVRDMQQLKQQANIDAAVFILNEINITDPQARG